MTTTTYAYTEAGDIILQQHVTRPQQQDEDVPGNGGSVGTMSRQVRKRLDQQEKLDDLKCGMCGFQGKGWKHLEAHLMTHSTYRPFKCKECGKGTLYAQMQVVADTFINGFSEMKLVSMNRRAIHKGFKRLREKTCGPLK